MPVNELSAEKLRRLAELKPDGARVLSIFLNLDPSEFATGAARATEIESVLDRADRDVRSADGLSHDEERALREDLKRLRDYFKGGFDASGALGLAVFVSGPADLFEVIKLPRPVEYRAVVDDSPFVEPLAEIGASGSWAVVLVNRRAGRMLRGSAEHLEELAAVQDDVHGQHDQGGWSQARYQRSVENEVAHHLKRTADVAFRRFQRSPFDRLLVGGPEEIVAEFEGYLHPYLRERHAGRVEVDVENTTPSDVCRAAAPLIEEEDRRREREALDRMAEGAGSGGRGTTGLDDVLESLNERRVATLLVREGYAAPGVICPQCGWTGAEREGDCPVDGTELEHRDDIIERAVELAVMQSAAPLFARHFADELEKHGSIGAVLRF